MEWISIEDSLPEKGRDVLVYSRSWGIVRDRYDMTLPNGTVIFNGTRQEYREDVTHWMPLPDPPVGSSHGG